MKLNNIRYTDEDINNLDDYYSKEIEEYKKIEKNLIKEINKLTVESTEWESKYYDLQKENEKLKARFENLKKEHIDTITRNENYRNRIDKAIEYLANCDWNCKDFEKLYDILGGDDNE